MRHETRAGLVEKRRKELGPRRVTIPGKAAKVLSLAELTRAVMVMALFSLCSGGVAREDSPSRDVVSLAALAKLSGRVVPYLVEKGSSAVAGSLALK